MIHPFTSWSGTKWYWAIAMMTSLMYSSSLRIYCLPNTDTFGGKCLNSVPEVPYCKMERLIIVLYGLYWGVNNIAHTNGKYPTNAGSYDYHYYFSKELTWRAHVCVCVSAVSLKRSSNVLSKERELYSIKAGPTQMCVSERVEPWKSASALASLLRVWRPNGHLWCGFYRAHTAPQREMQ